MSNRFILGFLLFASFSCENPQENSTEEPFNYRIDTVTVDAKGHIFYLNYSLLQSDYCQQDGFLYTYNGFNHSMDRINLDQLEFAGNYPLQREGPDGTGSMLFNVKSMGNSKLFLAGQLAGVFTLEGKLVKKFEWNTISSAQGGISGGEYIYQHMAIPAFDHLAFALVPDRIANRASLKMLNPTEGLISTYQIDPNGNFKTYTFGDMTNFNAWTPEVFINSHLNKLIVSHEYANDFYVYSPENDQLQAVTYSSIHTPSKVTSTTEGDLMNSIEDRIIARQFYHEQVRFGPLVWDSQNSRYYRLSSSSTFGEEKPDDSLLHKAVNVDLFLSVFDDQFNLLGEIPLPELKISSSIKYFVKDGMLWVFENMADEMGFIRVIFE